MIPYTLQLDLSGGKNPDGYFDVSPVSVAPFTEQAIDNTVTTRKQWGDVQIRNTPFEGVMLYDMITSRPLTQEIHIKFTSEYETIYGYFGVIDCKINHDKKVLNINVTTLDQYTEFIENRDTEIKLFDEGNVIANGDFNEGSTNSSVNSWTFDKWVRPNEYLFLQKKYISDRSTVAISDNFALRELIEDYSTGELVVSYSPYPDGKLPIYQTVSSIIKDRQMSLSFDWALTGEESRKMDLAFDIFLYDPQNPLLTYRLIEDGNNNGRWSELIPATTETEPFFYQRNVTQLPYDQASLINKSIAIEKAPITGELKILFYRYTDSDSNWSNLWENNVKLLLTNVILSASAIELKSITLEFDSGELVKVPQGDTKITWNGKKDNETYFYKYKDTKDLVIENMFDSYGVPALGAIPMSASNDLTYSDLIRLFEDETHLSYKFEMCELTVFRGRDPKYNLSNNRYWYAVAKFAREEITFPDHLFNQEDFDNGLCELDDIGINYQEPSIGGGWKRIGKSFWVRKPFNNVQSPWLLGAKKTNANLVKHQLGFEYYDSLTSVKQYPVQSGSQLEIDNAIDLRELIKQVYQQTHISLRGKNVYSNFLWNDALPEQEESDVYLGNNSGLNYVTMVNESTSDEPKNVLNKILAIHTYEFLPADNRTANDKEKSILKTSAKKLLGDLLVLFPKCYWFIDNNGDLHIEHLKHFDRINSAKDITISKYNYLGNYSEWEYAKDKLNSKEEYTTKNSGYLDFNTSVVTFDKIVSNKRGEDIKASFATSILSTDVQYCAENPASIDNGIVLVAYTTNNGINKAKYGKGQYSGKIVVNGDLSISTLLGKYATYEGTWEEGLINGKYNNPNTKKQTFLNTTRSRQGKEITIKGIFLDKIILSKLGLGLVKSRNVDYQNEITKIVADYRHSDAFIGYGGNELTDFGGGTVISLETPYLENVIVTNITTSSAVFNGNVLSDGGAAVTVKGFVYSTMSNPSIDTGTVVNCGDGIGAYSSEPITGLAPGTTYFVRAFATNSKGTIYSPLQYTFSTLIEVTIVGLAIVSVNPESAETTCFVSSNRTIVSRGVVWSLTPTPTTANNVINALSGGEGYFSTTITGLTEGVTYYARGFVIYDTEDVYYGNQINFTCN